MVNESVCYLKSIRFFNSLQRSCIQFVCPSVRLSVSQYVRALTRLNTLRLTFKFYTLRFSL